MPAKLPARKRRDRLTAIRFTPGAYRKIAAAAKKEDLSFSEFVRQVVSEHIQTTEGT